MARSTSRGASRRERAAQRRARARRNRRIRVGLTVAAVITVVAGGFALLGGGGSASRSSAEAVGDPVPDMSFAMRDGSTASLADYEGEPVVVNFFASWCQPCLREMPGFERVHQELGDRVRFLGVNLQDSPSAAGAIIEQTGITYDVALDPQGSLYNAFEGFTMPTTVFVNPDGTIAELRGGEISAGALRDKIEELFLA